MGCWHGYLSGARYRLVYGPADAAVSCFSKIQIGFAFLVPADMGSRGKRAIKRVYHMGTSVVCFIRDTHKCCLLFNFSRF